MQIFQEKDLKFLNRISSVKLYFSEIRKLFDGHIFSQFFFKIEKKVDLFDSDKEERFFGKMKLVSQQIPKNSLVLGKM